MTDAPVPRPPSFPREFFSGAADFAHFRIRYGGRLGEPPGGRGARAEARGAGAGAARGLRGAGAARAGGCGAARAPRGVYTGSRSRPSRAVLNGFLVARQGEKMDDRRPFFVDYYIKGSAFGSSKLNAARPI